MLKVCEKLLEADVKSKRHGLVRTETDYLRALLEAMADMDMAVEVEALKTLGDVNLEKGRRLRGKGVKFKDKAMVLYRAALLRCQDEDVAGSLENRIRYAEKLRSCDDHLTEGDRALADGKLDTAEMKFASALRQIHDPNKPDRSREAHCLRRLGDVYVQRGKRTEEGRKFTQAAALYNAAMARTDKGTDTIQASLRDAEKWFLHHTAHVDSNQSLPDSAMLHQKRLEDLRARAKSQLEDIDQKHNPYRYDEDDPKMIPEEAERAEAVKTLFKTIAKDRQTFIRALVDECIATLGPPPCRYAFIGLGSQATELVTPYSDLEFAILTEEGKDDDDDTRRYFLNLTHYLHLKVINLGETILPAMAIPSLNDFYSEDPEKNWFFDSVTPRGFSFDGFMPWACKTPFGRDRTKTKEPVSLIQTPAKMAEFQQLEVALAEGYHLSDILRRFAFLAGDEPLVREYQERLNEVVTNDLVSDSKSRFSAMQILQENREMLSAREPTGELLNVKKDIYRFPGIAMEVLALCCQVNLASTWAVIDRLRETGQAQEENAAHLTVLTGISAELRLRTYMANGGQKDNGTPHPDIAAALSNLGNCWSDLGDHQKAKRYFEQSLKMRKTIYGETPHEHIANSLGSLGYSWSSLGDEKIALDYYKQSIAMYKTIYGQNTIHPAIALELNNLGLCYSNLGDQKKAVSCYEQSLMMKKAIYGVTTCHQDIAMSHHNVGLTWTKLGNHKKAIIYYEETLTMLKAVYGKKTPHPEIAIVLYNIGESWRLLGDHRKAVSYFEQFIAMKKIIHGGDVAQPKMVMAFNNLGSCWSELGDERKAIKYFERSLRMAKTIYGENNAHPHIAKILHEFGQVWRKFGYPEKASEYEKQARCMVM
ncbi:PREDICTED: uncharacterized protein LOC109485734 [Branchiostoma belcheri]|uniref:Uncharacterized protein LOC109485734 n=1 Tax=Branchiostoma belcheri TaxID=7741 RepID=A0A6P5ASG9_BRABE|nr:PREDICTED: uncharacterized protein LOC109485734 [Branchiostoma belcheri]